MAKPVIVVSDAPEGAAKDMLARGIRAFNEDAVGYSDRRALAVLAKDPDSDMVIGGVTGRTSLGLLFLDVFYLPPEHRGAGLGSRILQTAEEEGRRRGCRAAVLYTISFQAPDFYERHGWRVFGTVECDPPGTRRIFMTKDL